MRKFVMLFFLTAILVVMSGCNENFTPSNSQCMYRCSKCGQHALMLNSVLKSQACSGGGTHNWAYNVQ